MIFKECKLLDICDVYQPHTLSKKEITNTGEYSVYGANGVIGSHYTYNHENSELVMGCRGSCGTLCITKPYSWINGNAMVIHPKDTSVLQKYLYFYLLSANKKDIITGTSQPQITRTNLSKFTLPIPSIDEQRRIVAKIEELFSKLDEGIAELNRIKKQLEIYRQVVLKEAFEGALTQNKNINREVRSLYQTIKERNHNQYQSEEMPLYDLPNGWLWVHIGDLTDGVEYGSSKKSQKNGQIPVLRMGNIQNGVFDWSDLVYTSDKDEINKYLLKENDVLFNRTNSPELVGKTAIYKGEYEAIFAGYLIRINQYKYINAEYLNYYLNSFTAKKYGNIVKTDGVNQSNINGKKLCSYPFPLCTLEEQELVVKEIEQRLSICNKIEQMVENSLQKAENLRQSILKQAFEGELV